MSGATSPLPNTPSWRGAQLKKAQGQIYFYFYRFQNVSWAHTASYLKGTDFFPGDKAAGA
jgi:hypothetical protein